jgi:hypothetical protein
MIKIVKNIMKAALITMMFTMLCINVPVFSQVEHNYEVGPQSANCDTLDITSYPLGEAKSIIELATFRYQQQFKISRTYGVMSARFYSCDGKSGYLVIKVDKKDIIYLEVPEAKWKGLISSADINGFYDTEIKGIYNAIKDNSD